MRYIVILFLLLGCADEVVIYKNCFNMTIPKGNPIKFWLNGEESFNSFAASGMQEVCFCGRWGLTDLIRVQVNEDTYSALTLKIWNSNDEEVGSVDFTETSDVFDVSFTLTSEGVTDSKVYFTIVVSNPTMEALATWTNHTGPGSVVWTTGANPSVHLDMGEQSRALFGDFLSYSGQTYQFTLSADISTDFSGSTFTVLLYDAAFVNVGSAVVSLDEDYDGVVNILATGNGIYVAIIANNLDVVADVDIDIDSFTYTGTTEIQLAESDCFLIDEDDTVLIQYGDKNNYAEIDYADEQIYSIRLAGRFAKERTPEENESDQTSDGAVEKLSSTLKDQKLLEIEYAPPYIHKLMKRVLNHNTIYIDGEYWVKEENYETRDVSASQPLQPASCWLTQKEDGYDTNVYGTVTTI